MINIEKQQKHKKNLKILTLAFVIINLTLSVVLFKNDFLTVANANSYTDNQVLELINSERTSNGLKPLFNNKKLQDAATQKTLDMDKNNYFAHISPSSKKWSDFVLDQKYTYTIAGENLAKDYNNPQKMVKAWMDSPSHRENILNNQVSDTGISILRGKLNGKTTIFVTQYFGKSDTTQ